MQHFLNIQYVYLLNKYIKCHIWRLTVRYVIYIYVIRRLKVKEVPDSVAETWFRCSNILLNAKWRSVLHFTRESEIALCILV